MKYYFGYMFIFGKPTGVKWTEEADIQVGGEFTRTQPVELTKQECSEMSIATCEATWPYKEPP